MFSNIYVPTKEKFKTTWFKKELRIRYENRNTSELQIKIPIFFPDVRIIVLVGLALGFIICTLVIIFVCRRKRSAGRVLRPAGIPHTRLVNYPGKTPSIFPYSKTLLQRVIKKYEKLKKR